MVLYSAVWHRTADPQFADVSRDNHSVTPVKCVTAAIPRYDGHLCHPEKGGLHQYQYINQDLKPVPLFIEVFNYSGIYFSTPLQFIFCFVNVTTMWCANCGRLDDFGEPWGLGLGGVPYLFGSFGMLWTFLPHWQAPSKLKSALVNILVELSVQPIKSKTQFRERGTVCSAWIRRPVWSPRYLWTSFCWRKTLPTWTASHIYSHW